HVHFNEPQLCGGGDVLSTLTKTLQSSTNQKPTTNRNNNKSTLKQYSVDAYKSCQRKTSFRTPANGSNRSLELSSCAFRYHCTEFDRIYIPAIEKASVGYSGHHKLLLHQFGLPWLLADGQQSL
ncbi:hypothetical protein TYRP_010229, partial [Tyrophagus putrescentiae]